MNASMPADLKLEVVILPVSDVDRAKQFYRNLGWREDADFAFPNGFRVVQFTPPGSGCSIQFGVKLTSTAPGSMHDTYLVTSDIEAARDELDRRGAKVSEVFHATTPGAQFEPNAAAGRTRGGAPNHASYSSFVTFTDPDGNSFLVQEVRSRLPSRGLDVDTATLADLLRDAEVRHGAYSANSPRHHWSSWYGAYIDARLRGISPEDAVASASHLLERQAL